MSKRYLKNKLLAKELDSQGLEDLDGIDNGVATTDDGADEVRKLRESRDVSNDLKTYVDVLKPDGTRRGDINPVDDPQITSTPKKVIIHNNLDPISNKDADKTNAINGVETKDTDLCPSDEKGSNEAPAVMRGKKTTSGVTFIEPEETGDDSYHVPDGWGPAESVSRQGSVDIDDTDVIESIGITEQSRKKQEKGWDGFREIKYEDDDSANTTCIDMSMKIFKVVVCGLLFLLILGCSVVSKGTFLFMTSNSRYGITLRCDNTTLDKCSVLSSNQSMYSSYSFYKYYLPFPRTTTPTTAPTTNPVTTNGPGSNSTIVITTPVPPEPPFKYIYSGNIRLCDTTTTRWIWGIVLVICVPHALVFLRSLYRVLFRSKQTPTPGAFIFVFIIETLHSGGIALFVFHILRSNSATEGLVLMLGLATLPSLLQLVCRPRKEQYRPIVVILDILAFLAQVSAISVLPIRNNLTKEYSHDIWIIPLAMVLTSLGWWENFFTGQIGLIPKWLKTLKRNIRRSRSKTYAFVSLWKIAVTVAVMLGIMGADGIEAVRRLFVLSAHGKMCPRGLNYTDLSADDIHDAHWHWMDVWLVQMLTSFLCYMFSKVACKVHIQTFSFAVPMLLTTPLCFCLLLFACQIQSDDPGYFESILPKFLFFHCPADSLQTLIFKWEFWLFVPWWLSQLWVSRHIWINKSERLAKTEKLFVLPLYLGSLVEQSMIYNRRKDEQHFKFSEKKKSLDIIREELKMENDDMEEEKRTRKRYDTLTKQRDKTPKLLMCATMWHENEREMIQLMKSLFRMDIDQSARRNAQEYLGVTDPDYYEFEAHIFFDDAFEAHGLDDEYFKVNSFVKQFISIIDLAASAVHGVKLHLPHAMKVLTPYGGKLELRLPGGNRVIVHLKDKTKIRHKKRWSQVMYMYYFLGRNIWEKIRNAKRKQAVAENTYLLALDGDVDFKPLAVTMLLDLMRRNIKVGAACGRIHPIGTGPLVWYQKFEYAVGHWFQKSTEHVIGCVLCSPGCFSLFRGSALMDDNVARRYTKVATEPMHYVQYDQGEDRWLCTLLLQQGYRVEYSAAADALTYAPEGFSEFFNQRRRWTPSTLANILDLLMSAKQTTKKNDNISWLYMAYQGALFGSSILGPGTVFLVIVGALQNLITAPGQPPDNIISISVNAALVVGFTIVCLTLKSETQLYIAAIISTIYSVVMMLVMVSTFAAIRDKGLCDVSTLFMIVLISIFVLAGLMHPHEFGCLLYGLIYYMVVPSTFVLLMIYSLCNLNNVSWGTREVKKTQFEEEKERLLQETNAPGGLNGTLGAIFARAQQYAGGMKEGMTCCGIRCLFDGNQQERQMEMRMRAAAELEAKRDIGDDKVEQTKYGTDWDRKIKVNHLGNIVSDDDISIQDDVDSIDSIASVNKPKTWIEDRDLGDGMIIELNAQDKVFWEEMIETYLKPIDIKPEDKERLELQLKELRNKVVFAFCMINILYITVVYVMQVQRISFKIPCVLPSTGVSDIEIQPIGTVFVVFFGFILLLQFVGMIFHRYETFMHIVSTTPITCGTTQFNDQSTEIQNALATARDLQKLTPDDNVSIASNITINTIVDDSDNVKNRLKDRRPTTMLKLVEEEEKQKEQIGTLSLAFAKRFLAVKRQVDITSDDLDIEEHLKNLPKEKYSKRRQSLYFLKNRPDLLHKPDLEKRLTLHVEHKDYDAAIKVRQRLDEENKKHGSLTNLEIQGDFPEQI